MQNSIACFYDIFESPVGILYLVFTGRFLVGISFNTPQVPFRKGTAPTGFKRELERYFDGYDVRFSPQIRFLRGTGFEKEVWMGLRSIPFGETRTYKWLAERVGRPKAARAVGQALAKNPIPIVLPCHRVIESCGSLGGYSSGVDIKRRLLQMEYYSRQRNP